MPSPVAPSGAVTHVFQKTIWPIFERKCVQCHGPEKQKSRYRLDDREAALRGGASGKAAIVPGEPMTSPLVQALLLPADRDEAMPPEGKDRLSDSEVMAVIRWIQGELLSGLTNADRRDPLRPGRFQVCRGCATRLRSTSVVGQLPECWLRDVRGSFFSSPSVCSCRNGRRQRST
jgi:hypothetical protein